MKKIAVLFHDANYMSGATRSMIDLIDNWINENKYEVFAIFPCKGSASEYLAEKGIAIFYARYYDNFVLLNDSLIKRIIKTPFYIYRYIISFFSSIYRIAPFLKKQKITLVYSNTSGLYVGALLKKYKKFFHVWHFREFGEEDHKLGIFGGREYFYKLANTQADAIICISKSLTSKYQNYIRKEIFTIYDDLSTSYINKDAILNKEKNTFLIAGQLSEGKGQKYVIDAIKILKNEGISLKMFIAGKEAYHGYEEYLKQLVRNAGLDKEIRFLGQVSDMNKLRQRIDFGIVASKSEAFGRVTLEGMLSGMVMLCANSGSNTELIEDGQNGILFTYGDSEDLAEKINSSISKPESLKKIRTNGFNYALSFTQGKCAFEIGKVLDNII